ncbi:MAG TPA: hypothetical protein VF396_04015, partial [Bradyrhizobium sp.]
MSSRLPGFFHSNISGSQYQLQSGKPVPGLDDKEPRSVREYSAAVPFIQGERADIALQKDISNWWD